METESIRQVVFPFAVAKRGQLARCYDLQVDVRIAAQFFARLFGHRARPFVRDLPAYAYSIRTYNKTAKLFFETRFAAVNRPAGSLSSAGRGRFLDLLKILVYASRMLEEKPARRRSPTAAEMLRSSRKALGLTQQEAAARVGVAKSSYCAYETGSQIPRISVARKIKERFNVPVEKWA
jgi:DNA-binding XRE family transcriptional regulator